MARVKHTGDGMYYNGEFRTGWFEMNDAEADVLKLLSIVVVKEDQARASDPEPAPAPVSVPAPVEAEPEPTPEPEPAPAPAPVVSPTAVEPMKTSPALTKTK